ncbi:MAG TPA: hypothetical protein VFB95_06865 [Candidatus Cryosericum sp.]|nr:hypothetical protein [Candidatus Cryosericum sp.]
MTAARLLVAVLVMTLGACSARTELCWVCQREITPSVRVTLSLEDGRKVHACCPRCALHYGETSGPPVRRIEVSDYASRGTIDLRQAWLIEGSDEAPCLEHHHPVTDPGGAPMQVCYDRCMPSLIAFASREGAAAFQGEHGGTLIPPGGLAGRAAADP